MTLPYAAFLIFSAFAGGFLLAAVVRRIAR